MLGGMPETFYTTYHDYFQWTEPEEQYVMRQELYQLYHCLNYLLIYGVRFIFCCALRVRYVMSDNVFRRRVRTLRVLGRRWIGC